MIFSDADEDEEEDAGNVGEEEEKDFEHNKLYGCGVAKMELWDSGDQFGNEKVHYLTFGSEIFLRKGNFAWRINTLIDNHSSDKFIYRHLLSYLQHQNNGVWWEKEAFLIDEKVAEADQKSIESPELEEKGKLSVSVGNTELNIKVPGETGSWFKKANYLIGGPAPKGSTLIKTNQETKEWSGIWIEDSKNSPQKIFQDIEVFVGAETNEKVFCKDRSKCGAGISNDYKISYHGTNKSSPDTWDKAYTTLTATDNSDGNWSLENNTGPTIPILKLNDESKGKWSNSNDVCNTKNTEIGPEELKKLKVFCSKNKG